MKKKHILWLCAGVLILGGCSFLDPEQKKPPAAGSDIIIERETTEAETEAGPSSPWAPPEETTIAPLELPERSTETGTVNSEIIIASDIHYLAKELTDFGVAFDNMAVNEDGKMVSYVWEITDAFLDQVIARRPQILILAGDLTLNGELVSQEAFAHLLKRVEKAGIPVVVIPGNHDINNPKAASFRGNDMIPAKTTSPEDFVRIYKDYGYGEAVSRDPSSLSYVYEMTDGTWLLMLDSCQYEEGAMVGGMIRTGTYEWMEKQLERAYDEGHRVITVSHHNLLDETKIYQNDCTIEHSEELERLLDGWDAGLFLSGHLHMQRYKTSEDYNIDEIVTSALSIYPCQYGVLQYFSADNYFYHTEYTDVTSWAQEKNNPDPNLHNFLGYANEFLEDIFYRKACQELKDQELNQEQIESMAKLYAMVNVEAVSGTAYQVKNYVLSREAYQLWKEYERSSVLCMYLNELLEEATVDYNERRRP